MVKLLGLALAMTVSSTAFAAEPAKAGMECCCKKDAAGKMACCGKMKSDAKDPHAGHDMPGAKAK